MNNAIRQLRGILASPPNNKPLTQAQLAEITDVPLDSLRGIEAGRQVLSPRMKNRIRCETAAAWNEQDQCWRFWKKDGPKYSREYYLRYREVIDSAVEQTLPIDVFLAALRIKLLMETLSPKARFKFLFRLNTFLEDNRKEFCPAQFAELFEDASSYIEAHPELDREHPLVVFRRYQPRLVSVLWSPLLDNMPQVVAWFATRLDPADYELLKQPQSRLKKRLRQDKVS